MPSVEGTGSGHAKSAVPDCLVGARLLHPPGFRSRRHRRTYGFIAVAASLAAKAFFSVCPLFPPRVTVAASATAFVAKLGSTSLRAFPPTPLVRWESRRAGKSGVLRRDSGDDLEAIARRHCLHARPAQDDGEGQTDTSRMNEDDCRARLSQLFRRTRRGFVSPAAGRAARRSSLDILRCRASGDRSPPPSSAHSLQLPSALT